jgi:hypothetical protein
MRLSLLIPGKDQVMPGHIDGPSAIFRKFMTAAGDVPSIGEGGYGLSNVLFLGVVVTFHVDNRIADGPLVDGVDNKEDKGGQIQLAFSMPL